METEIKREYFKSGKLEAEYGADGLHFAQMPFWIMSGLRAVTDEVHIGYVMNDDAISYLGDIQKIWNSYKCIHDKLPKLKFPLAKLNKEIIKSQLPDSLFQEVFSCENPHLTIDEKSFVECGTCVSCNKNKYYNFFNLWPRNRSCDTKASSNEYCVEPSYIEDKSEYPIKYDPFNYKSVDLKKKALLDNSKTRRSSTLKTYKKYAKNSK
jgi:hypothetical protein